MYMLENGLRDDDLLPERLFVLPTTQGQSWSLRKLAAVFDSLPEPGTGIGEGVQEAAAGNNSKDVADAVDKDKSVSLAKYYERRKKADATKEWGGKRLLLALVDRTMGGDGTVVYYVVQEGNVKPRQH
jgi:tRNA-splicing endonuclease subunit Sen15